MLVLEKWGWVGEVFEYCARSELNRVAGWVAHKAFRSRPPKEHELIVSPPAWRGAALQDGSSIG